MKPQLLVFTLLFTGTASVAQSLEQSFRELIADFKKTPYAYVQARYAPDLRFIAGHNGEFRGIDRMVGPNTKVEDIQVSDLKFFESGDLAVVSGINTSRYANPGGAPGTYKDAFTYTFRKLNGKWKHVAMQHTKIEYDVPGQASADEAAIKATIEQESGAFRQGKVDQALSHWLNAPYVSHDYTEKGSSYLRSYATVSNAFRTYIGQHPEMATDKTLYQNNDYLIRINGNSAWATFITDIVNGTEKRQTHNARYLEKVGGAWKLVGVTGKPVN